VSFQNEVVCEFRLSGRRGVDVDLAFGRGECQEDRVRLRKSMEGDIEWEFGGRI
jgi:hypothetical protein